LITGRRKTLKKFDLSEHYRQRKPKYVTEFIHEMLWGKTLQKKNFPSIGVPKMNGVPRSFVVLCSAYLI